MKKINNLIFILTLVLSLSGISLGYSVGEEVEVEVYGYCKGPNGTLTATGVHAIAGKTAAVNFKPGTSAPALKYGTIVYLESTGKSYVICDVGTEPKYTSLAVEPFCNTVSECYAITRNRNSIGNTKIKILHVPTGGNNYQNVSDSLAKLDQYSGASINTDSRTNTNVNSNTNGEKNNYSASVSDANTCPTCGSTLKPGWYINTANKIHYRVCAATERRVDEHQVFDINTTRCTGVNCKLCPQTINIQIVNPAVTLGAYVTNNYWAKNDIDNLKSLGIDLGSGVTNLDESITVKEFIHILTQVANRKGVAAALITQNDLKLVLGNNETEMKVNSEKPITREQAAVIIGGLIQDNINTPSNILGAKDWNNVTEAYKVRINKLVLRKIFRGSLNPDGSVTVEPKANATRAEAMALINRLYNEL